MKTTKTDTVYLEAGDTVLVPLAFEAVPRGDWVYVGGEVKHPGRYFDC